MVFIKYKIISCELQKLNNPTPTVRNYSSADYRWGFNGKEKDDEVKGSGNQYDYGFRIYDPRLGRFLSVDPLTRNYPWYSPYLFAGNRPIWAIDLDGFEEIIKSVYKFNDIPFLNIVSKTDVNQRVKGHTDEGRKEYVEKSYSKDPEKYDINLNAHRYENTAHTRYEINADEIKPIESSNNNKFKEDAKKVLDFEPGGYIARATIPPDFKIQFKVNETGEGKDMFNSMNPEQKQQIEIMAVALLKFKSLTVTITGSASTTGTQNVALATKRAAALGKVVGSILETAGASIDEIKDVQNRIITADPQVATGAYRESDQNASIEIVVPPGKTLDNVVSDYIIKNTPLGKQE